MVALTKDDSERQPLAAAISTRSRTLLGKKFSRKLKIPRPS
jgi:hypothetical protein